jgi:hypothetical protein
MLEDVRCELPHFFFVICTCSIGNVPDKIPKEACSEDPAANLTFLFFAFLLS